MGIGSTTLINQFKASYTIGEKLFVIDKRLRIIYKVKSGDAWILVDIVKSGSDNDASLLLHQAIA